jgi:hypothetical protein
MIALPVWVPGDSSYGVRLSIWHNQQTQDAVNTKNHDDYVTLYNNWIVQNTQLQAYHQPIQAPLTPPQKIVFNDDGTTTLSDFPDLKPTVLPPLVVATSPGITGLVAAGTPAQMTQDQKLDAILVLLNALMNK